MPVEPVEPLIRVDVGLRHALDRDHDRFPILAFPFAYMIDHDVGIADRAGRDLAGDGHWRVTEAHVEYDHGSTFSSCRGVSLGR